MLQYKDGNDQLCVIVKSLNKQLTVNLNLHINHHGAQIWKCWKGRRDPPS